MNTVEEPIAPPGRSWRNIRQEVQPLAMSRKGRRRQRLEWLKVGTLLTLGAGAAWGVYVVAHSWENDRAALASAVHSDPVRQVVLITNGVLTQKWVTDVLALPKSASLMGLELPVLRDRLLVSGQVSVAVLTRSFPDTLVVTLQERTPVARLSASEGAGPARQLLVAKDGVVYDGWNYDKQMLASLPWLDGIRLVKSGTGFQPLSGMGDVAALLSTAQLQAPHLYREWLVVSLARLDASDEIVVKAQDIPEIIFSRKRDFFKQIAQLDYIVDRVRVLPEPTLLSVNLALEGQVPVKMLTAPDDAAGKAPVIPSLPSTLRKTKRDL